MKEISLLIASHVNVIFSDDRAEHVILRLAPTDVMIGLRPSIRKSDSGEMLDMQFYALHYSTICTQTNTHMPLVMHTHT